LQQRDDVPGILWPGRVGLFGGHREGNETFLECAVRELHEELSYFVPPECFEFLWHYDGPDWESEGKTLLADFFVVRNIPIDQIAVTEGSLRVVDPNALADVSAKLTPGAVRVIAAYSERYAASYVKGGR